MNLIFKKIIRNVDDDEHLCNEIPSTINIFVCEMVVDFIWAMNSLHHHHMLVI